MYNTHEYINLKNPKNREGKIAKELIEKKLISMGCSSVSDIPAFIETLISYESISFSTKMSCCMQAKYGKNVLEYNVSQLHEVINNGNAIIFAKVEYDEKNHDKILTNYIARYFGKDMIKMLTSENLNVIQNFILGFSHIFPMFKSVDDVYESECRIIKISIKNHIPKP